MAVEYEQEILEPGLRPEFVESVKKAQKAISKILSNPEHFKSLRWPLENTGRVHALGG